MTAKTRVPDVECHEEREVAEAIRRRAPGDYFEAQFDAEEDTLVFRRIAPKADWLALLKECPVSMDDVPARRRELPHRRKL